MKNHHIETETYVLNDVFVIKQIIDGEEQCIFLVDELALQIAEDIIDFYKKDLKKIISNN
jgi:hypothetical protein